MKTRIRKIGREHIVMVPKWMLSAVGIKGAGPVEVTASGRQLFVASSKRDPQPGATREAAREVGAIESTAAFDRVLGEMVRPKRKGQKRGLTDDYDWWVSQRRENCGTGRGSRLVD